MSVKQSWENQKKIIKATQIAFEMDQDIARSIRTMAAQEGLNPSDQIRKLIGLTYSPPKRPRLTVSLRPDDYAQLAEKYGMDVEDRLGIKHRMMQELVDLCQDKV